MNLAAREGSISLYTAVGPDGSYVELADLESMDDGGLDYTTMGVGAPEPDIGLDGRSVSAAVDLYSCDDTPARSDPLGAPQRHLSLTNESWTVP